MKNVVTSASDDTEQYSKMNADEIAQLVEHLCVSVGAIAGNDADNLYESDREQDMGFLLATIEGMFEEQADFHDEIGLYMGEYINDSDDRSDANNHSDGPGFDGILEDILDEDDCPESPDHEDTDDDDCRYGIGSGDDCLGCPMCPVCPQSIKRYVVEGSDIRIVLVRR